MFPCSCVHVVCCHIEDKSQIGTNILCTTVCIVIMFQLVCGDRTIFTHFDEFVPQLHHCDTTRVSYLVYLFDINLCWEDGFVFFFGHMHRNKRDISTIVSRLEIEEHIINDEMPERWHSMHAIQTLLDKRNVILMDVNNSC